MQRVGHRSEVLAHEFHFDRGSHKSGPRVTNIKIVRLDIHSESRIGKIDLYSEKR